MFIECISNGRDLQIGNYQPCENFVNLWYSILEARKENEADLALKVCCNRNVFRMFSLKEKELGLFKNFLGSLTFCLILKGARFQLMSDGAFCFVFWKVVTARVYVSLCFRFVTQRICQKSYQYLHLAFQTLFFFISMSLNSSIKSLFNISSFEEYFSIEE